MTSNILSTQWVPELLDHANAHAFQQPARPPLRHPSRTDLEPALKKQRLDHDSLRVASSFESHVQRAGLVGTGQLQSPRPTILTTSVPDRSFPTPSNPSSTARLLFPTRSTAQQRQERTHCQNPAVKRSLHGPGEVRIKPYAPEIPSPAPRFSSTSKPSELPERDGSVSSPPFAYEDVADFSPWIGNHAEDVLSESATKHGFSDKIQISQAETSTARSSVWGSLKHKTHLQVLSSLVVSVLDQRQAHGTNTAGCTFKRPPRLGLTDSKREAWLRDLANPAISLRRLSRTIPYGITGRPLLDQCLGKNIPTARSLWLAKSVGANQLRAFKRKGASGAFAVGGESKWIRDWTANVEQFLDALIDSCSSPEWKRNLNYG